VRDHTNNLECWRLGDSAAPRTAFQIGHEMDTAKMSAYFGGEHIISGNLQTDLLLRGHSRTGAGGVPPAN